MRNDVFERMKWFAMEEIPPNFSAIARQYQVDRRTVKAAYDRAKTGETKQKYQRRGRKSKLDEYKELINAKVEAQCTAKSIYCFIKKKGFQGGYTIVRDYCRSIKKTAIKKVTTRVEHTIGQSAQVDWKEHLTFHTKDGTPIKFSIFLYVLPYSKLKFLRLTTDQKQDTLFQCLYTAFQATGGVPKEIWFDNMSTVVDHEQSTFKHRHLNDRFLSFAKDAYFKPIACQPYRPQTKGCVEALARTVSRLKPYDGEFTTLAELERVVDEVCQELNQERSQGHNQIPLEIWPKEKEHLQPVNPDLKRYFNRIDTRIISQDSMVRFRNHQYSVPPEYIGKAVQVKEFPNENSIRIYYQGAEIRSHKLTDKSFIYNSKDHQTILKSDLMAERSEDQMDAYMHQDLSIYDDL